MSRQSGTVKEWGGTWGFILPDGGGRKVFVHYTGIDMEGYRTLEDGQRVFFTAKPGPRGPVAVDVRPMGGDDEL